MLIRVTDGDRVISQQHARYSGLFLSLFSLLMFMLDNNGNYSTQNQFRG